MYKLAPVKKKSRNNKILALEKKLNDLEKQQANKTALFFDNEKQIMAIHEELNELYMYKVRGAMLRARLNWIEYAEKPTSYFFKLEKTKPGKN